MRRVANPWDRFYRHQAAPWRGEHPVAGLVPLLGAGPVLELGCGNGKMLRPLRAAGVDAVGLDVSWHALHRLGRAAPTVLADAQALPFLDASFSAVLDVHCTGHLAAAGRRAAAQEVSRVLKPGGRAVVERLGTDDLRTRTGTWVEGEPWTRRLADGRTTHFSDEADLRSEYGATGLAEESSSWTRRSILHRGEPVLRSAIRVVWRRP